MNDKFFRINLWFYLLLVLLLCAFSALVTVQHWLTADPQPLPAEKHEHISRQYDQLILSPQVINNYVQKDNTKSMQLKVTARHIVIQQKSRLFGSTISTNILTTPVVIGHNKLQLNIEDASVGNLPLSKQQTLSLISHFGSLPAHVKLDVKRECFYYHPAPIAMAGTKLELQAIDDKGWHFNIKFKE